MALTWASVVALDATLADTVPADAQAAIVAQVELELSNASAWPTSELHERAKVLLAAHYGTIVARGALGNAGPVIGESAGPLSKQYGNNSPTGSDPTFDATPWGKQFQAMRKRRVMRGGLT